MELTGCVALVTGGARRLGRAVCEALALHGADVVVHIRTSVEEAEAAARAVADHGRRSWILCADLEDLAAAEGLAQEAARLAGGNLHVLVNSASIFPAGTWADADAKSLTANMDVNAFAPFLLSRAFARIRGASNIVNFLDSRITDNDREHFAYHLSKRTLLDVTRLLALELAPAIRVNAVAPGLVLPPPGMAPEAGAAYLEARHGTNPLDRHGEAQQVVDAVLFLLANDFVTGQVLYVDGGRHLRGNIHGA
jgi:NAD(P)-dependent dehydrogenase (short-subunit alcohol dehydrogenase family)